MAYRFPVRSEGDCWRAQTRLNFTGACTQALEISQCAEGRVDSDLTDTFTVLLQVRHMAMQVTVASWRGEEACGM